jgi:spore photoproduct lyase
MRADEPYKQGIKLEPTRADPDLWVYEFGTNSDLSVDAAVSDTVRDIVGLFRELPNAKATFATKFVNRCLLEYDPQGRTRLRFSLMPPQTSRLVDVRTSKVEDRILAINDFVEAGYEVNVNFGPVIIKEGWQDDYAELFGMIDASLAREAKTQLAAEVIFLTHSQELHEMNLRWHPEGRSCSGGRTSRSTRPRRRAASVFSATRGPESAPSSASSENRSTSGCPTARSATHSRSGRRA